MKSIRFVASSIILSTFVSTLPAQVTSQFRQVTVNAMARDAIFDEDDVIVDDDASSILDGLFDESLSVTAGTITGFTDANAIQLGTIVGNSFSVFSEVDTRSVEDGASSNQASSTFQIEFDLKLGGTIEIFQLELTANRAQINDNPQDDEFERSDDGTVAVMLNDLILGLNLIEESLVLERDDLGDDLSAPQKLELPAGSYRLTFAAQIDGDDAFNQVQGQPRGSNLTYCIAGEIIPDILGDVNCDGELNLLDVQPFVDLLATGSFSNKADTNRDGSVNLLDVQGFVELLAGA